MSANAKFEEMEKALRWIVKACDVKIHRLSLFDEIQAKALEALGGKKGVSQWPDAS